MFNTEGAFDPTLIESSHAGFVAKVGDSGVGNRHKVCEEYVGLLNTDDATVSITHTRSPAGPKSAGYQGTSRRPVSRLYAATCQVLALWSASASDKVPTPWKRYWARDLRAAKPVSERAGFLGGASRRRAWSLTQTRNIGCLAFLRRSMTRSRLSSR